MWFIQLPISGALANFSLCCSGPFVSKTNICQWSVRVMRLEEPCTLFTYDTLENPASQISFTRLHAPRRREDSVQLKKHSMCLGMRFPLHFTFYTHTHTLTEGLFLFAGLYVLKCMCFCLWCNVWRSPSARLPEHRCSRNISMSSTGARFVDSLNQRSGAEWEEKRQSVKEGKRKEAKGAPMCQECADASF